MISEQRAIELARQGYKVKFQWVMVGYVWWIETPGGLSVYPDGNTVVSSHEPPEFGKGWIYPEFDIYQAYDEQSQTAYVFQVKPTKEQYQPCTLSPIREQLQAFRTLFSYLPGESG